MTPEQVRALIRPRVAHAKAIQPRLLEALLLAQIAQESNFNERAVSRAGAKGLAQFTDATWQEWGNGDPFDPEAAIDAQVRYMKYLYSCFTEIPDHLERYKFALGSYNAGRGNINKALALAREFEGAPASYATWKKAGSKPGNWQYWWHASQFLSQVTGWDDAPETLSYVSRIFNLAFAYLL